jgi:hypothetical protein
MTRMTPHATRTWHALAILAVLLIATLPGTAVAQQAAAPAADPFTFTSDAALVMWQVQPDKALDFEMVWRVIRQRVETAGSPEVKALFASTKMYQPGFTAGDALTYVFYIDPIVKAGSYSPTFILFESKLFERAEADELFAKMSGTLAPGNAISTMPLNRAP